MNTMRTIDTRSNGMFVNTLVKSFAGLTILAALILPAGCQQNLSLPGAELVTGSASTSGTSPTDTTPENNDSQAAATPSSTGTGLTVTSPTTDVSCAVGQPVLVAWETQGLASGATVSILVQVVGQSEVKTLVSNLPTYSIGSCQIDTFSLVPGLTYTLTVRLSTGVSATASGQIIMINPVLNVTSPTRDSILLPSQTLNVAWTGQYLPAGGTIEAFLDFDRTYDSGNEVVVQTLPLPATGASMAGSVTLQAADLWNLPTVNRGVSYYVGLRVVKNGHTFLAAYAPATAQLYNGQGFNILSPLTNTSVLYGSNFQVAWSTMGVPATLTVQASLVDRATGAEILMPSINVTQGTTSLLTYALNPSHTYSLVAKLQEGQATVAVRNPAAVITVITTGSSISISNTDLAQTTDKVFVGIGNSYDITWTLNQPPQGGMVRLFLDQDGNLATTADQVEITPAGGVPYTPSHFVFTPTDAAFPTPAMTDKDYWVVAQVMAQGVVFTQNQSRGKIHVGAGGIDFTIPKTDVTVGVGDPMTVTWTFTGNILNGFGGKKLFLRLYANEKSMYDNATVIELTDPITGLQVRNNVAGGAGVTSFTFNTSMLIANKSYYIIGRLFVEGNTDEETRAVSAGKINVNPIQIVVDLPAQDVTDPAAFPTVQVHWTITGLDPAGRLMRILAVQGSNQYNLLAPAGFAASSPGSQIVDVSKLPPGTYSLRCIVFDSDAKGVETVRATGDASGRIIIPFGYSGTYDLADMSAVVTKQYSPIDGTVFNGGKSDGMVGYEVAGIGDMTGDNLGDFIIFAQNGLEANKGRVGGGYLIYGKSKYGASSSNTSVVSLDDMLTVINGTRLLFPTENSALPPAVVAGSFKATAMPDFSGDEKGDLILSCLENRPLVIKYTSAATTASVTFKGPYRNDITLAPGGTQGPVPMHCYPNSITFTGPADDQPANNPYTLFYGVDYTPGNQITVQVDDILNTAVPPAVIGHKLTITSDGLNTSLATNYLLTSDRLLLPKYRNNDFDLIKVGSPMAGDNDTLSARALDKMLVWATTAEKFGTCAAPVGDLHWPRNNAAEFVLTTPEATVTELADPAGPTQAGAGVGLMFSALLDFPGIGFQGALATTYGTPGQAQGSVTQMDLIGSAGAAITSVAGLGSFPSMNDHSTYLTGTFDGSHPAIVVGCPGENASAGAVYIVSVPLTVYGYVVPQMDFTYFNQDPPAGFGFGVPVHGIKLTGTAAGDTLGKNVVAIGDFDGDGLSDFVIAMPNATSSTGKANAGQIKIVFGKTGVNPQTFTYASITGAASSGLNGLIFEGDTAGDHFGSRVCSVYDVNGDGATDLLVAAPDAGIAGRAGCGKVYLIYGRPHSLVAPKLNIVQPLGANTFVDYDLDGNADGEWSADKIGAALPGAVFVGENAGDQIQSISSAGNVNGDTYADFLIGSPQANVSANQQKAGKGYLVLGRQYTVPTP